MRVNGAIVLAVAATVTWLLWTVEPAAAAVFAGNLLLEARRTWLSVTKAALPDGTLARARAVQRWRRACWTQLAALVGAIALLLTLGGEAWMMPTVLMAMLVRDMVTDDDWQDPTAGLRRRIGEALGRTAASPAPAGA